MTETEIRTVAKAMAVAKFNYPGAEPDSFMREAKVLIAGVDALLELRRKALEIPIEDVIEPPTIGNVGTA